MQNELKIRTPEGVVFALRLAGPVVRMIAWNIDAIVITAILICLGQSLSFFALISPDVSRGLLAIGGFFVSILYGILSEWYWRGQTLGKRFLRLRVIDEQGLKLQFGQIVIRNLLRFVDMLPLFYLTGGIACAVSLHKQRLGDLAAGTIVVREQKAVEPDLDQLGPGKFNSLREYTHLAARLRQHVSPEESRIALQALLRRNNYEPEARVNLFAELAAHFKKTVPYPPEVVEAIADEQYVRDVVEILFRRDADRFEKAGAAIGKL